LQAAGSSLIVLRGLVADIISMMLANTLIQAGALIILIGLERFTEKKGWHIHNYVLLAVFIALFAYYSLVQPDLKVREIALSAKLKPPHVRDERMGYITSDFTINAID
jgi:hypothetical protein